MRRLHGLLLGCRPLRKNRLPGEMGGAGVYLFSENDKHLYVGRSKEVRDRVMQHSRISVLDAPFAFKRTREALGKGATYRREGSRKQLLNDPVFAGELARQKQWISTLDVRYVHVDDPVTQAVLEIYSSDVLDTPYNDFTTT